MSRCAACQTALTGATNHGEYRLQHNAAKVVAACSPPCAMVGILAALVGMPAQKRTASTADLDTKTPMPPEYEINLRKATLWLDLVNSYLVTLGGASSKTNTSDAKAALLSIGRSIRIMSTTAREIIVPVQQSLQELRDNIIAGRPYDMQQVIGIARNAIARLSRLEMDAKLHRRGALSDDSSSYLDRVPSELHPMVANRLRRTLPPTVTFVLPQDADLLVFGTTYLYTTEWNDMDQYNLIDVWEFDGSHVDAIGVDDESNDEIDYIFEPAGVRSGGELWFLGSSDYTGQYDVAKKFRGFALPPDCFEWVGVDPAGNRALAYVTTESGALVFKTYVVTVDGLQYEKTHRVPHSIVDWRRLGTTANITQFFDNQIIFEFRKADFNRYIIADLANETFEDVPLHLEPGTGAVRFIGRTHIAIREYRQWVLVGRADLVSHPRPYSDLAVAGLMRFDKETDADMSSTENRIRIGSTFNRTQLAVGVDRFIFMEATGEEQDPDDRSFDGDEEETTVKIYLPNQ